MCEDELAWLVAPKAELARAVDGADAKREDAALVCVAGGECDLKLVRQMGEGSLDKRTPLGGAGCRTGSEDRSRSPLLICE